MIRGTADVTDSRRNGLRIYIPIHSYREATKTETSFREEVGPTCKKYPSSERGIAVIQGVKLLIVLSCCSTGRLRHSWAFYTCQPIGVMPCSLGMCRMLGVALSWRLSYLCS